jgi:glutamine amidotransferase PdxT
MAVVGVLALQGSFNEHIAGTSSLTLSHTHTSVWALLAKSLCVIVYRGSAEKARGQRRGDKEARAA